MAPLLVVIAAAIVALLIPASLNGQRFRAREEAAMAGPNPPARVKRIYLNSVTMSAAKRFAAERERFAALGYRPLDEASEPDTLLDTVLTFALFGWIGLLFPGDGKITVVYGREGEATPAA